MLLIQSVTNSEGVVPSSGLPLLTTGVNKGEKKNPKLPGKPVLLFPFGLIIL